MTLRRLNYHELIRLDLPDPDRYSFRDYKAAGRTHPRALDFCSECERNAIHEATDGSGFRLNNISHGTHARDFLDACGESPDTATWHHEGVLFVFESPSLDYGQYESTTNRMAVTKRPARRWFWVHEQERPATYPTGFVGRKYEELLASAIFTFRLAGAYVTNLVKCGMNSEDGEKFRPIAAFRSECVETCFARFLAREIDIVQPVVIFAFGGAVEERLKRLIKKPVHRLPHPAHRGLRNDYFRYVYFGLMLRALHEAGIIPAAEARELSMRLIQPE